MLNNFTEENKPIDKFVTNAKIEDQPQLFGKSGASIG